MRGLSQQTRAARRRSTRNPDHGTITLAQQDGQPEYTWTWTDRRKLHFNAAGKLDRITSPTGEAVRLLYDSQNTLVRAIAPRGRSLNKPVSRRAILRHAVGTFRYEYGSTLPKGAGLFDQRWLLANLVRVRMPDHFDPDTKAGTLRDLWFRQ